MPVQVLGRGGRIAAGVLVSLFALQTFGWLFHDVAEFGLDGSWSQWLGSTDPRKLDTIPATAGTDVALFLLQTGAVFAAFTAARTAGGLLAAAVAATFLYRLPTLWLAGNHTADDPWYVGNADDAALVPALLLGVLTVLLAAVAGIVLLAARRPWPPIAAPAGAAAVPGWPGRPDLPPVPPQGPEPVEGPARPAGAAAAVTALVLAVLALTNLGWNGYLVFQGGVGYWADMFSGSGTVGSVLAVPPAFRWLVLTMLCGLGAILAITRSIAARGFALGVALLLVPEGLLTTLWYIDHDLLFELGQSGVEGLASRLQTFVTLVGGIAVLVLMGRAGTPVDEHAGTVPGGPFPGPQPAPGGWQQGWGAPAQPGPAPYQGQGAAPSAVPQQPTAPPAWGPQPGTPQSGPAHQPAAPQQPPAGYGYPPPPAQSPGTPAQPPQGGFGPPPQL